MKKNIIKVISILILINITSAVFAKIENKIILKIENEIITNYEIKNKILRSLVLSGQAISQDNINRFKSQALDTLVQLKIKKIELQKYDISKNETQINAYLNSISSNNILSLKEKFKLNNLSYELFLEEIEIESKWQKLIFQIYSSKINIDENIINEDLKKLLKNKISIKELNLSEIELLTSKDKSDKEKIFNLLNEIEKIGFESAALKYSISSTATNKGNLGWVNSKSLSKEIYDILKKMKPGQISEPINRQNSILILKLNDVRVSKTEDINIAELKERLLNQKKNELFNLYSKSHLSKLKNNSLIEYK
tara:strand:+ start:546 stop:1475 length:930 start_codon:yes stop_codon:yes gene_type:complete